MFRLTGRLAGLETGGITAQVSTEGLEAGVLLEEAARKVGLDDFGGGEFREGLEVLLKSLREEARLNARGVFLMRRTVLRLLSNRLLTEQAFAEAPEMGETPVAQPLFVLGFPRTGTTLLHNLLACDPQARWLRLWEGLYPAPPPRSLKEDSRIADVEEWALGFAKVAPRLVTAHKLEPRGPEECLWLIEHTFTDLIFELRARVPAYSEWLAKHEGDGWVYQYFNRQLRMLGTHCRGRHWVLKAPRHLAGLAGLLEVFPEARVVQTHRDPAEVLPSLCSLCEILQSAATDQVDKQEVGKNWRRRLANILKQARAVRKGTREGQFLDVRYADLVRDPVGTVRDIYEFHGYEYSSEMEAGMRRWLAENRQHKHGTHKYSLEEYGLEAAAVRREFSEYCGEYGL